MKTCAADLEHMATSPTAFHSSCYTDYVWGANIRTTVLSFGACWLAEGVNNLRSLNDAPRNLGTLATAHRNRNIPGIFLEGRSCMTYIGSLGLATEEWDLHIAYPM